MMIKENITSEELEDIANKVDIEGFWYALTSGGYLKPEDLLEYDEDIKKVKDAISIVREFEDLIPII